MKRTLAWLLALALSSASCPAWSRPAKANAADDKRARDLFKQGDSAYAEGRYEDALAAFEEAHRLSQRPRLMFNIGNALERLGKLGEAATALEKYLPHAKATERDVIAKRVENLRKRATPLTKVELEEEPPKAPAKDEQEAADPPVPVKKAKGVPVQPRTAEPSAESNDDSNDPTWGYLLVTAGGVALGAGGLFGVMALSARKDVDASCKDSGGQTLCDASGRDAMNRDQRYSLYADLGLGLGVVLVGTGVYLLVSAPSKEHAARVKARVVPDVALGPRGGTIRVRGEF